MRTALVNPRPISALISAVITFERALRSALSYDRWMSTYCRFASFAKPSASNPSGSGLRVTPSAGAADSAANTGSALSAPDHAGAGGDS
jgi:hypothetical protein